MTAPNERMNGDLDWTLVAGGPEPTWIALIAPGDEDGDPDFDPYDEPVESV